MVIAHYNPLQGCVPLEVSKNNQYGKDQHKHSAN
jgi:hypothetical protein